MKLVYLGGQTAGLVGLLACVTRWPGAIQTVVAYDGIMENVRSRAWTVGRLMIKVKVPHATAKEG